MMNELPENSVWWARGIGDFQLTMNILSLVSSGGVRIGLEDNIFFDTNRKRLASNKELLDRIINIAKELGKTPYSPKEARKVLGVQ